MSRQPGRGGAEPGQHLVLYDGACGLCDRFVQFVLPRDRAGIFRFAPLQSGVGTNQLARFGARADALDTISVIANYQGSEAVRLTKGRGACFVLSHLDGPWRFLGHLDVLPQPLLNLAYDLVARTRYRLFGRLDHCLLPGPEHAARFLDTKANVSQT